MRPFIDSNILVYAFSNDRRRDRALAVAAQGGVISVQTLNEVTNVLRKKLRLDWSAIEAALRTVQDYFDEIVPLTAATHSIAMPIARDHGLAFYDALIVAAALEAGCDTLFTEDLQDGRIFGGLTIRNPFRDQQ